MGIALATPGDYSPLPGLPVNIIPLLFSFFFSLAETSLPVLNNGPFSSVLARGGSLCPDSLAAGQGSRAVGQEGVNLKGTVCCFCSGSILPSSPVPQPLAAFSRSLYTKEPKGKRENFLLTACNLQ